MHTRSLLIRKIRDQQVPKKYHLQWQHNKHQREMTHQQGNTWFMVSVSITINGILLVLTLLATNWHKKWKVLALFSRATMKKNKRKADSAK